MVPLPTKIRFKKRLLPIAEKIREEYGIDPDLCITQAAHESNWGESWLARAADNLFGMIATPSWLEAKKEVYPIASKEYSKHPPSQIKYWSRPGDVIEKRDDGNGGSILMVEVVFRKYRSWDDSVRDWAEKITTKTRYAQAYNHAKINDADGFFESLQGNWATDPNYALKLKAMYKFVQSLPNDESPDATV